MASNRTWGHLWELAGGSDAPLMPYYAILKAMRLATARTLPASMEHLEVLERWPSAVAVVIACALLAHWLATATSPALAACSSAVLLLTSGVSRYGQEARPYGLVLMLAVLTTVLWWKAAHDKRIRWILCYSAAVTAMVAMHTLSASLLAAHVVAAVILPPGGGRALGRVLRLVRTMAGSLLGLLAASPFALMAIGHGTGAAPTHGLDEATAAFRYLFNGFAHRTGAVSILLVLTIAVLPLIAVLSQWFSVIYGSIVRLAVCWAVIPLAALCTAALTRPNLVATRYILFVVPGWAILAGVGLLTVVTSTVRGFAAARAVQIGVVLVLLAGAVIIQRPALSAVRAADGHGENIRALLAAVHRPELRNLPIEVFPPSEAIQLSAYQPGDEVRLVNVRQPQSGPLIWTQRVPGAELSQALRTAPAVIILVRGATSPPQPRAWAGCRLASQDTSDRKWSMYLFWQTKGGASCTDV